MCESLPGRGARQGSVYAPTVDERRIDFSSTMTDLYCMYAAAEAVILVSLFDYDSL